MIRGFVFGLITAYPKEVKNRYQAETAYCRLLLEDSHLTEADLIIAAENYAEAVSILGTEEPLKTRRQKIDYGKIGALYNTGWSAKEIADEMNMTEASVRTAVWKNGGIERG